MTGSRSISNLLPPRLSMDDYADFVETSLRDGGPARTARQKELEERIQTPFRMGEYPPVRPACNVVALRAGLTRVIKKSAD